MKKIGLFVLLVWGISFALQAQSEIFHFEKESLSKVQKKAKKEKKLIFMFCHTKWCDACRLMEKQVLPDSVVADFYNRNFIAMDVDMLAEVELAKKYNTVTYPALLFLNEKGEVVHRAVGYHSADEFIRLGKVAGDKQSSLSAMDKRFKEGERGMDFVKQYIITLRAAGDVRWEEVANLYIENSGLKKRFMEGEREPEFMEQYAEVVRVASLSNELNEFVPVYLNTLSPVELATRRNWEWLAYSCRDLSRPIRQVIDHQDVYIEAAGGAVKVNWFVARALMNETAKHLQVLYSNPAKLNEPACDSLVAYMRGVVSTAAPVCITKLLALKYLKHEDYKNLLACLQKSIEYNIVESPSENSDVITFLGYFKKCNDTQIVSECVKWLTPYMQNAQDEETKKALTELISELSDKLTRK